MKKQIIVINGGNPHDTYEDYLTSLRNYELDFEKLKRKNWKETLGERLGQDFEVILLKMPNPMNAKYNEWEIMFNKLIPFLDDTIIFIGHSLGGIFLIKYLSENEFPKKILATFLISAPYDEKDADYSLTDFNLSKGLEKFQKQGGKIFLYHSKDDPVVPFTDLDKYKKVLPEAKNAVFEDRGHFYQTEFVELIKDIKNITK